jgi:homocysteine S-methyltransferase
VSYSHLATRFQNGGIIILDGATGTELEKLGAPMSGETWCAEVNGTHAHLIEDVHRSYIAAGADVITANTFATSPLSFNAYGRDDDVLRLDSAAVAAAKRAVQGTDVAVAGSISTMRPVVKGSDRTDKSVEWPADKARQLFRRKARNLADNGVDLLVMEMMRDRDYSLLATEAALETGLPVWVGISLECQKDGRLTGFGREDQDIAPVFASLAALKPQAICIMHTSVNDIQAALPLLRESWQGPVGIYPESGYFKMPSWQFENIISPSALVAEARTWVESGVTILGGCCGLGPEHVSALAKEFKR